ncbi:hypothetical protein [Bacillus suaedaesalsae]|uniref:VanZ-like domain-containing protein n=1 Tax=Bacillus suaedaesalsae TaxID=2810349 RepID=A0ABS2DHB8_9BACI|nr:hypothetical protein [Bacillus suaedaesalsae]MBM6617872.1 hypothetical protein [Bacillus suaedaesalsae]
MYNVSIILGPLTPKDFDENELFVIAIIFITWFILFFIHRKDPVLLKTEIVALFVFNMLFATVGDRIFAEPPLDFYDTLDYAHGEFFDSILQILVYPLPVITFIHFYQKFKLNNIIFILLCAFILMGLEWISAEYFNLFQFKKWENYYSYLFYCFAMVVNILYFKWIGRLIKEA